MTVIGSAGTARGLDLVLQQGAAHVVDHTKEGYIEQVRDLTGGSGPELILEMLANVNLAADLDLVAKYGRIIVIGNRGEITINARMAMMKELDIRGIALFNGSAVEMSAIMADLVAGLEDGSLTPIVGRRVAARRSRCGPCRCIGTWCVWQNRTGTVNPEANTERRMSEQA